MHVSVIAPNAIIVTYGVLFGGMHPTTNIFHEKSIVIG